MLWYILLFSSLSDPFKVLPKLQYSLHENIQTLALFTNNQSVISDHQELLHLLHHFKKLKNRVDYLVLDVDY